MKRILSIQKCALCGEESEQYLVASTSCFDIRMRLDNRPVGTIYAPFIDLYECPHCHYVNNSIEVNLGVTKKDIEAPEYTKIVNSHNDNNEYRYGEIKKYILYAMLCEKIKNFKEAGKAYQCVSWLFENIFDIPNERYYALLACEKFLTDPETCKNKDYLLYCVDIYRRQLEHEKAQDILNKIGITGDIYYDSIVKFQKKLLKKRDSTNHYFDEIRAVRKIQKKKKILEED